MNILMNIFKRFFRKDEPVDALAEQEKINERISDEVTKKVNELSKNLITDISDLKLDYFKRYLETRMDASTNFLSHLSTRLDLVEEKANQALLAYEKDDD